MIEVTYNLEDNRFKVKSNFSEWVELTFNVLDLNTNLGVTGWWTNVPPSQENEWHLPSEYISTDYFSGFKLKGFKGDELVVDQIYQFKKEDKRFQFVSSDKEIAFGSWESLVHKDQYKTKYNSKDIVYDLGANFGVYSMWALYNGVKQVYAFEPTPFNVECLNQTFKWDHNITIFSQAISDKHETKTFYIQPHSLGNSLHYTDGIPTKVECVNLEEFVKENNLLPPTIIKCDIEGAEYDFIKSTSNEFFNTVREIIIEFHLNENGTKVWELTERFLNLGYKIELDGNTKNNMGTLLIKKEF
jgi:FkbM family methyltransferase